jgi:hypothetical protein
MASERALEVARGFFYLPLLRMYGFLMDLDAHARKGNLHEFGQQEDRFIDLDRHREFTWPVRSLDLEVYKRREEGWLEKEMTRWGRPEAGLGGTTVPSRRDSE